MNTRHALPVLAVAIAAASSSAQVVTGAGGGASVGHVAGPRRVPAEWEPHDSTWMQWPRGVEASYRPEFAGIIDVLQDYETIHLIVQGPGAMNQAQNYLLGQGVPLTNIQFEIMPYDWAWMRDNGPVWVERGQRLVSQDWGFDGWGGLVQFAGNDDLVPCEVADIASVRCEDWNNIIYERGALEFNGRDAVIASWPVMVDRNPLITPAQAEAAFRAAFGVSQVVWLQTAPPDDLTKGHVDSICRFIDEDTVVVSRFVDQSDPNAFAYEEAAAIIDAAGFDVVRMDIPGYVTYFGFPMYATYVNWLVANDVVVMTGFGVPAWDNAAKATVEGYFPGRDVHVVTTLELWYWGGGVHCVTNDQPLHQ